MRRIEAIADAIGKLNGVHDPESEAYQLRNPLLLKSFARPGKHETDDKGRRVFPSLLNGYRAGIFDLEMKVSGNSRARISADSPLTELLACYEVRNRGAVDNVVSFIRRALRDQTISSDTTVSYFSDQISTESEN